MFTVADRSIGVEHEPYIIAELSANHNGSLERALESIVVAARSGADAIKIQTYTADTMTLNIDKSDFLIKGVCGMVTSFMIFTKKLKHL